VRQALKIQVCTALVSIIGTVIPIIGWLAIGLFAIIVLVLNIICFLSVCKGEAKEPPIISSVTFLK
ncbi:MAG: zinc ribbon domain-containing protein, partial [Clostridia bacterium]|nr:zinc ribbon domain-containing protein [Clostridia bacterium]